MTEIEPGAPYGEILAALQDATAALAQAVTHTRQGRDGLAAFDLWHVEDALEQASKALNAELLYRTGDDDET